jgi:macrolide transport system ATP-binding/permease protein
MLVDEPTNHLAPVLVEQLEAALSEFAGTLVMVSHDRALGEWFSTCARRATDRETRHGARQETAHGNAAGNWLRYAMRDGALA